MKTENLRNWNPTASDAVHVNDTKMLDTQAREPVEHVSAVNKNEELIESHPSFGELGAKGRN